MQNRPDEFGEWNDGLGAKSAIGALDISGAGDQRAGFSELPDQSFTGAAVVCRDWELPGSMELRDAIADDFEEITAIYNHVLTHSTAIYNDRPASTRDRVAWWRSRLDQHYPVLVATDGQHICGFGSFGDFRSWPGYRFTVEGTVHVAADSRGQGVGSLLLNELIVRARLAGKHSMIAGVDSENAASLRFLERYGFERVGFLPEIGHKFDRFLNLVLLQYWITPRVGPA